jgi:hypothetical protein
LLDKTLLDKTLLDEKLLDKKLLDEPWRNIVKQTDVEPTKRYHFGR